MKMSSDKKKSYTTERGYFDDQPSTSFYQKIHKTDSDENASNWPKRFPAQAPGETSGEDFSNNQRNSRRDSRENSPEDVTRISKRFKLDAAPAEDCERAPEEYSASGLKSSLHGTCYQLKILMLFLKYGVEKGYSFALATEMDAAEKFDDVVFKYKENDGKLVYRFLQAKHKQDHKKLITVNDLLTEKDGEFSLQKYFISFCKIMKNPQFKDGELKDFVICTNIDFEENLKKCFQSVTGDDEILNFEQGKSECLKLKFDEFPQKNELISILEKSSECNRLAKRLAKYVKEGKVIDLNDDLFKIYHRALRENVIEAENIQQSKGKNTNAKFYDSFLSGNLQGSSANFRKSFFKAYQEISQTEIHENEFWQNIRNMKLKISHSFATVFKLDDDPQLTDYEKMAEEVAEGMSEAKNNIVRIEKRRNIIKENIHRLAGYVFIERKNDEEDTYHFSSAFFDDNYKLPGNLANFKTKLKAELQKRGALFHKDNYKFKIREFKTCEEDQLHCKTYLPSDDADGDHNKVIKNFFKKLVFAVNQPNEIELGHIIEKKMNKYFNLTDGSLTSSSLQEYILDWMKAKKGCFLTHLDGKEFFMRTEQKISNLVAYGSTLEYCAEIESFGIEFSKILPEVKYFLASTKEQIFNFISSPETTTLSSMKIIQGLKEISACKTKDSFIAAHLHTLLLIQDCVIDAFSSESSNNLLVIECDASQQNIWNLFYQLSSIMENQSNKKIILVTNQNDTLAEEFKNNFSKNGRYMEKEDEENRLVDLTETSQKKLLTRGKVIFQEADESLSLGSLFLDDKSKYSLGKTIQGKLLLNFIKNQEIKIGKAPKDPKYDIVKKYFINRSFSRYVLIRKEIEHDESFFVIDMVQMQEIIHESNAEAAQDIVIISDKMQDFTKCCDKNKNNNVHWLEDAGTCYKWQQSRGSLSKLQDYADFEESFNKRSEMTSKFYDEESFEDDREQGDWGRHVIKPNRITDIPDRVVLITSEPGVGKSVILSHLAVNSQFFSSQLWIVRCNLVDYSDKFNSWIQFNVKITKGEAIKFLYEITEFQLFERCSKEAIREQVDNMLNIDQSGFVVCRNDLLKVEKVPSILLFEVEVFTHFYNQGKIALLLDGFDEISPDYKNIVIELLTILKDINIERIWITTRPYNLQNELENTLDTFSYTLELFSLHEQFDYLKKFWGTRLKLDESDSRASDFIKHFLNLLNINITDNENNFFRRPLQMYMIAHVFFNIFSNFYTSGIYKLDDKNEQEYIKLMDLNSLFEKFIEMMFVAEQTKENTNFDCDRNKVGIKRDMSKKYKELVQIHRKLAVNTIFGDKLANLFFGKSTKEELSCLIEEVKKGIVKTGIIVKISNDLPNFIHQSFAEYFVADYLWEKFKSIEYDRFEQFIHTILIGKENEDRIQIIKFFCSKAKTDLRNGVDFLNYEKKLETFWIQMFSNAKKHCLNTAFCNCISEYEPGAPCPKANVEMLLGMFEHALKSKRKTSFKFYENIEDDLQQYILLWMCADSGYAELAKALAQRKSKSFFQRLLYSSSWETSVLLLAGFNEDTLIIKILAEKIYDINWVDKDGLNFISYVLQSNDYRTLELCIMSDVFDVNEPYKDHFEKKFPILEFSEPKYALPSHVLKLIIEKTDVAVINESIDVNSRWAMLLYPMIMNIVRFDDTEVIDLVVRKGFDFSCVINVLLCQLANQDWYNFTAIDSGTSAWKLNLFGKIDQFLKSGVGYNCKNIKSTPTAFTNDINLKIFSFDQECNLTTAKYCKQVYLTGKLLKRLHEIFSQENADINHLSNTIFKMIIDSHERCPNFEGYEVIFHCGQIYLLPRFKHESFSVSQLERVKQMDKMLFDYFSCDDVKFATAKIFRKMLLKSYKNNDTNIIQGVLDELNSFIQDVLMKDDYFKQYPHPEKDEQLTHTTNEPFEVLQLLNSAQYDNLNKSVKVLLNVIIIHCAETGSKIDEVFLKVSKKAQQLRKVMIKLIEAKKKQAYSQFILCGKIKRNKKSNFDKIFLDTKELMNIFEINSEYTNDRDLQQLISEIDKHDGILLLRHTLMNTLLTIPLFTDEIVKQIMTNQSLLKYFEQSSQMSELFEKLDGLYKDLTEAIKNKRYAEIENILEKEPVYKRSIMHGQDEKFGSPLHYAASKGDIETIKILLTHGADPNLRLNDSNMPILISIFENSKKVEEDRDWSLDYYGQTPLNLASLNGHKEIVQLLIDKGAKIDALGNN